MVAHNTISHLAIIHIFNQLMYMLSVTTHYPNDTDVVIVMYGVNYILDDILSTFYPTKAFSYSKTMC